MTKNRYDRLYFEAVRDVKDIIKYSPTDMSSDECFDVTSMVVAEFLYQITPYVHKLLGNEDFEGLSEVRDHLKYIFSLSFAMDKESERVIGEVRSSLALATSKEMLRNYNFIENKSDNE